MTESLDVARAGLHLNWSTIWDRVAATVPERIAVRTPTLAVTYEELEHASARLAATLLGSGVGRGDRVGLFLYNRIEYLVGLYAAFKIGAIPVNLNFRYRSAELAQLLRVSRAVALIHPTSLGHVVREALLTTPVPLVVAVEDSADPLPPGARSWGSVLGGEPLRDGPPVDGDDTVFVFTGGTTGLPKAAVHRHATLLQNQLVSIYGAAGIPFPTDLDEIAAVAADERIPAPVTLPITPLMHAMALFNSMDTLVLGGTVVFLDSPSFDPGAVLRTIEERRVTRLIIAGNAVAVPLVDTLDGFTTAGVRHDLSSVQLVMSSGMAWTDAVKARMLAHFDAQLFDIVGSSEGGPYAYSSVWSHADLPSRLRLAEGAVVLDAEGRELDAAVGGVGLLASRGPMPEGYFEDPVKTAEVYQEHGGRRYVVPGDWVRLADGGIEFLGRGSAVVNTGGEKVYPAEVEDALLALPEVADCVVFGIPDDRWGQVVAAVVQPVPGATFTAEAVAEFLGDSLAGYKKPRRIAIVDSIGRSPSGKADLAVLRARFDTAQQTGKGTTAR